jgi:hypothetical protein
MPRVKRQKAYQSDSESGEDEPGSTVRAKPKPLVKKAKKKLVVVAPDEPRVSNNFFASALQAALATNESKSAPNDNDDDDDDNDVDTILTGTRTAQQRQADRLARHAKASGKRERRAVALKVNRQERPAFDEVEKRLAKVAASGVVQLFNALKRQRSSFQRQIKAQTRDSDKDRVNIQPKSFLAALTAADNAKKAARQQQQQQRVKSEVKHESKWSVLRDDFLEKESKAWDAEDQD